MCLSSYGFFQEKTRIINHAVQASHRHRDNSLVQPTTTLYILLIIMLEKYFNVSPSKDALLSWLCLTTRSESRTVALGGEEPSTFADLFRHEFDSLSRPESLTTSLFSPAEKQSTVASGITPHSIPYGKGNNNKEQIYNNKARGKTLSCTCAN